MALSLSQVALWRQQPTFLQALASDNSEFASLFQAAVPASPQLAQQVASAFQQPPQTQLAQQLGPAFQPQQAQLAQQLAPAFAGRPSAAPQIAPAFQPQQAQQAQLAQQLAQPAFRPAVSPQLAQRPPRKKRIREWSLDELNQRGDELDAEERYLISLEEDPEWLEEELKELKEDPIRQQEMQNIQTTIQVLGRLASRQQNPATKAKTNTQIAQLRRQYAAFEPMEQLEREFDKIREQQDRIAEELQRRTLNRAEEYNEEAEEGKEEAEGVGVVVNPADIPFVGEENFRNFVQNQLSTRYNVSEPEFIRTFQEVHGYSPYAAPAPASATTAPISIPAVRRKTQQPSNLSAQPAARATTIQLS